MLLPFEAARFRLVARQEHFLQYEILITKLTLLRIPEQNHRNLSERFFEDFDADFWKTLNVIV
jgi:gluconate kinase